MLPLTEKQQLWAFRHCLSHYAFRTKSGMTTCMDCGHQWNETKTKNCHCPRCGTRLEICDTLQRKYRDKSYYSILTTQDGLQVQRVFLLTADYRKGKKAEYYSMEIVRYWLDEDAKYEIIKLHAKAMDYAGMIGLGKIRYEVVHRYADRLIGRTK